VTAWPVVFAGLRISGENLLADLQLADGDQRTRCGEDLGGRREGHAAAGGG